MPLRAFAGCAAVVLALVACGSGSDGPIGSDGGPPDAAPPDGGGGGADARTPLADCSPACTAGQVCVRPVSCQFDARCVARSEVTCSDAGAALCSVSSPPACAGNLDGDVLSCLCR